MSDLFQTQLNSRLLAIDNFKSLNNLLEEATTNIDETGKKILTFTNQKTKEICSLNFSSIIHKGMGINYIISSKDRKTGKMLEDKLKKLNDQMDLKIKNSNFIIKCFAFIRSFFSMINPFSCTKKLLKNGFSRLEYYTLSEWQKELPRYSLPKYPDQIKNAYLFNVALYKSPLKTSSLGRNIFNSLGHSPLTKLTSGLLIVIAAIAYYHIREARHFSDLSQSSEQCSIKEKELQTCLKEKQYCENHQRELSEFFSLNHPYQIKNNSLLHEQRPIEKTYLLKNKNQQKDPCQIKNFSVSSIDSYNNPKFSNLSRKIFNASDLFPYTLGLLIGVTTFSFYRIYRAEKKLNNNEKLITILEKYRVLFFIAIDPLIKLNNPSDLNVKFNEMALLRKLNNPSKKKDLNVRFNENIEYRYYTPDED